MEGSAGLLPGAASHTGRSIAKRIGVLLPLLFAFPVWLSAHDFWIEPSSFHPAVGSEFAVFLRVGQDFRGEPVPRNPRLIERFVLVAPAGAQEPIGGLPGSDPAGLLKVRQAGLQWIAYRSGRTPITLPPDKFEEYLADEGMESILVARQRRGERGREGREVFSRSAKSLIAGNGESGRGFDRPLGLTLELVPEKDPLGRRPGGLLPLKLLYEGRPLPDCLVVALQRGQPQNTVRARTDGEGRVSLKIAARGAWLVKAVHMIAAPPETGADWESIWASLTFEIP